MTVRLRVTRVMRAAPSDVWAAIEDLESHSSWMADAEWVRITSTRRHGVGTTMECLTRVGPFRTRDLFEVTEWRPGAVIGIAHRGLVTGQGRFTLRRTWRGRTRFVWDERLAFPRRMGGVVGERLARPILRRIWKRNLARLEDVVLSDAAR